MASSPKPHMCYFLMRRPFQKKTHVSILSFFVFDITAPGAEARIGRLATPLDRAYAAARRRPLRGRQSLAGRALVRLLLERVGGLRPGRWRLCREHDGRPVLRSADRRRQIAVSISH